MFEDDDSGLLSRSAGLQIPDVSKNLTAFIFKRQEGVKNKVRPRTGYEGPEGDYRYRSTLSLTSALDGGEWLTPHLGRFTPGKGTRYPLHRMLGGPQGRSGLVRKISHTNITQIITIHNLVTGAGVCEKRNVQIHTLEINLSKTKCTQ